MKFKQETLSNETPANDNYDLILKNMLITNPDAFQSYVGNRLWGLNNNAKRKISAGKLTQIIEKYKLSTKIPRKLEERIRSGDQSNTDFYVFDYTNFNYFIHFFDESDQLMLIKKAPKSTEEYSFADVLNKPNNTELEKTTTTTTTTTMTQPPKN